MKNRTLRRALIAVGLVAALVGLIVGPYEVIRTWRIREALLAMGPADAAEMPRVALLLHDYNPMIREAAARALGQIGTPARAFAPDLVQSLKDPSTPVRAHAAWALGHIQPGAAVIDSLVEALDDPEPEVRRYAAFALMMHGPLAEPAVPGLIERLGDPNVAPMAANALGAIGPPARRSIPHLITALRADQDLSRLDFISSLGKFGADAGEAVPDLRALARDPDPEIRKGATAALRSIEAGALVAPVPPR